MLVHKYKLDSFFDAKLIIKIKYSNTAFTCSASASVTCMH